MTREQIKDLLDEILEAYDNESAKARALETLCVEKIGKKEYSSPETMQRYMELFEAERKKDAETEKSS